MNKKLIWKFNIMDLLIIGILILGLAALIYRGVVGGNEEDGEFEVTYICEEAPLEILSDIKAGLSCADGDAGSELGSVSSVHTEPIPETNSGSAVIKAVTEGSKTNHGILIDDTAYLRGKKLNLIVGDTVLEVYISDIN